MPETSKLVTASRKSRIQNRYRKQFLVSNDFTEVLAPRDFTSKPLAVCVCVFRSRKLINETVRVQARSLLLCSSVQHRRNFIYDLVVYIRWKSFHAARREKAYMRPLRRSCGSMELTDTHITGINDTRIVVYMEHVQRRI